MRASEHPRGEHADLMLQAAGEIAYLRAALMMIRSGILPADRMIEVASECIGGGHRDA